MNLNLLAQGRWLSPGTPASSTTKTGRHDIAEILLKVALNTKNSNSNSFYNVKLYLINNHDHMTVMTVLLSMVYRVEPWASN
jgi:hypothetical protein